MAAAFYLLLCFLPYTTAVDNLNLTVYSDSACNVPIIRTWFYLSACNNFVTSNQWNEDFSIRFNDLDPGCKAELYNDDDPHLTNFTQACSRSAGIAAVGACIARDHRQSQFWTYRVTCGNSTLGNVSNATSTASTATSTPECDGREHSQCQIEKTTRMYNLTVVLPMILGIGIPGILFLWYCCARMRRRRRKRAAEYQADAEKRRLEQETRARSTVQDDRSMLTAVESRRSSRTAVET